MRADDWLHAASTYKTAVMLGTFAMIKKRRLALSTKVKVSNRFKSVVDGTSYKLPVPRHHRDTIPGQIGKEVAVSKLLEEMITVSSNLATNILIQRVGVTTINETLKGLGIEGIRVVRGVQDIKAYDLGINNKVTAFGLMQLYIALAQGKAVDHKSSERMIEILLRQRLRKKIPAKLPRKVAVAHKTGTISTVSHDAGIVFIKGKPRYVVAVVSRDYATRRQVASTIAMISKAIYRYVISKHPLPRAVPSAGPPKGK